MNTPITIDIRADLLKQRANILDLLVELAGEKRDEARHLVSQLAAADTALASLNKKAGNRFAAAPKIIDAVLMCLDEFGRAATRKEIEREILDSGYRELDASTAFRIGKSLDNFLTGTGSKTKNIIRERNSLIGRYEWDDSYFQR